MVANLSLSGGVTNHIGSVSSTTKQVYLDLVKKHGDIGINSSFRSVAHNKKVKGAKNSQHIHRRAIDLATKNLPPEKRQAIMRDLANDPRVGGLGVYSSGAIHFDTRPRQKNGDLVVWGNSRRGSAVLKRQAKGGESTPTAHQHNHASTQPPAKVKRTVPVPRAEWTPAQLQAAKETGKNPTKTIEVDAPTQDNLNTLQATNQHSPSSQQVRQQTRGNFLDVPNVESANSTTANAIASMLSSSSAARGNVLNMFERSHRNGGTEGEIQVI